MVEGVKTSWGRSECIGEVCLIGSFMMCGEGGRIGRRAGGHDKWYGRAWKAQWGAGIVVRTRSGGVVEEEDEEETNIKRARAVVVQWVDEHSLPLSPSSHSSDQ